MSTLTKLVLGMMGQLRPKPTKGGFSSLAAATARADIAHIAVEHGRGRWRIIKKKLKLKFIHDQMVFLFYSYASARFLKEGSFWMFVSKLHDVTLGSSPVASQRTPFWVMSALCGC